MFHQPTDVIKTRFQVSTTIMLSFHFRYLIAKLVINDGDSLSERLRYTTKASGKHLQRWWRTRDFLVCFSNALRCICMDIQSDNFNFSALYRGTVPVLCIVGPRVSLQYMGLAMYKPMFEKLEGKIIPSHSSAGLAGVSVCLKRHVAFMFISISISISTFLFIFIFLTFLTFIIGLHWHHTSCYSW